MQVKTSELQGTALDWAVAKCEGALRNWPNYTVLPAYTTDWAQGGPIIEREKISVTQFGGAWKANNLRQPSVIGPTPLIAAMRCYVSSKLGNEVEIPEELV